MCWEKPGFAFGRTQVLLRDTGHGITTVWPVLVSLWFSTPFKRLILHGEPCPGLLEVYCRPLLEFQKQIKGLPLPVGNVAIGGGAAGAGSLATARRIRDREGSGGPINAETIKPRERHLIFRRWSMLLAEKGQVARSWRQHCFCLWSLFKPHTLRHTPAPCSATVSAQWIGSGRLGRVGRGPDVELLPTSRFGVQDSAHLPAATWDDTHGASPTRRFICALHYSLCGGVNAQVGTTEPGLCAWTSAWPSLEAGLTSLGSHPPTSQQLVGPSGLAPPCLFIWFA